MSDVDDDLTIGSNGWYDERLYQYETASMDKKIAKDNVGYQLLLKMGWDENKGLGKNLSGMYEPLKIELKQDFMGLGKKEIDDYWTDPDKVKRKTLESEKLETPQLVETRKQTAEKEEKIKSDVMQMTNSFYCELCDKRYKRISEYEAHLDSYDHHHKKRLMDMQKLDGMLKKQPKKKEEEKILKKQMEEVEKRRVAIIAQQNQSAQQPSNTTAPQAAQQVKFAVNTPKTVDRAPIKFGLKFAKK